MKNFKIKLGHVVLASAFVFLALVSVKTASAAVDFTGCTTMMQGSTQSACVMKVQGVVNVTADGKFGPMTKAAVMAFQTTNGLVADGVVGPLTMAKMSTGSSAGTQGNCPTGYVTVTPVAPLFASCAPSGSTPTTPTGPLTGGAGSITVDGLSTYSSEDVGEGEEDVKILAFEIEADDGSDVDVSSVKVELFQGTAADSEDLTDYADNVSVWMGSTKVGSADADDFSENSDVYSRSISLDGAIVKAGETEKFYVAVSALSNLDSGDIDTDAWYGGVSQVRFMDAEGVVTTETVGSLDIDDEVVDDEVEQTFNFASYATASDVELKVALNNDDDDINEAHVINVDASDDTEDVEVLSFTLEADGDSDINVTEIPVLVTTTGETDEAVIVIEAKLWMDGEELATEDVPTGGAVTFQDLDIDINAGDEVELMVTVSLQDVGGVLDDGDTVKVELTGTEVDAIEAEDESGEELGTADLTGTAAGEAHATYDVGFFLDFVSSSQTVQTNETSADVGTYVIKYKVTAFDGDIYVDNTCVEDNDGSEVSTATSYSVTNPGSNGTTCVTTSTGDTNGGNAFLIEEGTSETITLTVSVVPTADSFAQIKLEAIGWDDAAGGDDNVFDFNLPSDFETDPLFLNFTA